MRTQLLVVVTAALAIAVTLLSAPPVLRAPVVFAFVAVCPGAAVVRWIGPRGRLAGVTVAVAVSLALAALASEALAIAGVFAPRVLLVLLAVVTVAIALLRPLPTAAEAAQR